MKKFFICFAVLTFFGSSLACAEEVDLKDGTYEGGYAFIRVSVTVSDGKISDINILDHGGGGGKYKNMIEPLLDEMIKNQSTEADAVTGATRSSEYLSNAVQDAVTKATIKTQQ